MTQDGAGAPETPETVEAARAVIAQQLQELDRQKATIEQQAREIARLRRRIDDDVLVRDLREAVRLSADGRGHLGAGHPRAACST